MIYFLSLSLLFSAKTKDGVQEAFEELVHKVLQTPELYIVDSSSQKVVPGTDDTQYAPASGMCGCSLA